MAAFFMQRLEWAMQDARFKIRGKRNPHPDVSSSALTTVRSRNSTSGRGRGAFMRG